MTVLRRTSPPTPTPPEGERRLQFHHDLYTLEEQVADLATLARSSLTHAVDALVHSDDRLGHSVIDGDDDIDRRYQEIERRVIYLLGRQQPVASDLRLLVTLLHTALHLERIGDAGVTVAESAQSARALPASPEILGRIGEMGQTTTSMIELAVEALTHRDRDLCQKLLELDDRVDQLHRDMIGDVLAHREDPQRLEWALRTLPVSRALERAADHAVDIAEQAWFLITGELGEFD